MRSMRSGPSYWANEVSCACAPSAQATGMAAASMRIIDFMNPSSIADVLQEPFGGKLAPQARPARRFEDEPRHREELGALHVAPFRIRHLVARASRARATIEDVRIADLVPAGHVRRLASALHGLPARILWARDVAQVLVGHAQLGPAHRRGRGAETQLPVEARERRIVGTAPDRDDMHAGFEPFAADHGPRRVGAGGEHVRAAIDLPWLVEHVHAESAAAQLVPKALAVLRGRAE